MTLEWNQAVAPDNREVDEFVPELLYGGMPWMLVGMERGEGRGRGRGRGRDGGEGSGEEWIGKERAGREEEGWMEREGEGRDGGMEGWKGEERGGMEG